MKNYVHNYNYFYGVEITPDEIRNGYVNYSTLAKTFNTVLCNDIVNLFWTELNGRYIEPEIINGFDYDEESDTYPDIFQYYIIDNNGADILSNCTDEIIYYLPELDLYVWGVTHFGTPWCGVDTDIKVELKGV
jgi:hypothetical protein